MEVECECLALSLLCFDTTLAVDVMICVGKKNGEKLMGLSPFLREMRSALPFWWLWIRSHTGIVLSIRLTAWQRLTSQDARHGGKLLR